MRQRATQRIARSTAVIAGATSVSRILGFVRDLLMAALFGTAAASQAFVVAFRLPNMLRDLAAEGAMASAVVPVLSWYRTRQPAQFWRLSHALLTQCLVWLCLLSALGVLAAPAIVRLIAPGFAADPDKLALTIELSRLLFPLILLVGLWAYFMALLNSLGHFAMPALGPALLNCAMIAACLATAPGAGASGVRLLAVAVLIGGAVQLLIQWPPACRLGFRYRPRWRHEGSRRVLRLLGPRTLGSAVYQGNVFIHTALASLGTIVGEGAVAALYFGNRLVQLPLALFGTATAQASLPSLSEQAAAGDLRAFRETLLTVVRLASFIMLPAAAGLMVLAEPIVGGLFERGAFDRGATAMTAQVVAGYAAGLLGYTAAKIFSGAFYALQDTRTPVRLAIEAVGLNILASLALMGPCRVGGLAIAAALSSTFNAYRLARVMERRLDQPLLERLAAPLVRMGAASLLMAAGCWTVWWRTPLSAQPWWLGLPAVVVVGLGLYALACRWLGVPELSTTRRWLATTTRLPLFAGE